MSDHDDDEVALAPTAAPHNHNIIFLPFLRLGRGYHVAGIDFLPLQDAEGATPDALKSASPAVTKILSGYFDRQGTSFSNCVVATIGGRWDVTRDDWPAIRWASSLLFLASWSANEYFRRFGGAYVNSVTFRLIGQSYSGELPHYISIAARRRDGQSMDGGYQHGEVKFPLPVQCSVRDLHAVDERLLEALNAAHRAGGDVILRLKTALPFIELANTDDDFMTVEAEGIPMAHAFEQLLQGRATAYKLGEQFGMLFHSFGSKTVADVMKVRPDIKLDRSTPERAEAQPKWWVHRKWLEELYDLRSNVAHAGGRHPRRWGWTPFEHLLMAAHVFPLVAKLLLRDAGHYQLSDDDHDRCCAVDPILASPEWFPDDDNDRESENSASNIFVKIKTDAMFERDAHLFYPPRQSDGDEPITD